MILSEHNCRCFSLAVFLFFERGVGFPGDGEWPHHFTFLHICLPSPFPCFPLCVCLSRSLGLLGLDQVACEHNTQTLTVTGLYGSSSSSLLLFHLAGSPPDQQTAVGKANLYHWGSEIKSVLFKFSGLSLQLSTQRNFGASPIVFVASMMTVFHGATTCRMC